MGNPFSLFKNLSEVYHSQRCHAVDAAAGHNDALPLSLAQDPAPVVRTDAAGSAESRDEGLEDGGCSIDSDELDDSGDEDFTPDSQASSDDEEPLTAATTRFTQNPACRKVWTLKQPNRLVELTVQLWLRQPRKTRTAAGDSRRSQAQAKALRRSGRRPPRKLLQRASG
ncbi:hypothetical protein ON010_g6846 [Phytophthora cinnamomi]|nr:hypothetical protein ON010_g6846 [Phytophthora cinnamomi]